MNLLKRSVLICAFFTLIHSFTFAEESDINPNDAAENARKAHELASSDVIYQQQDFKALYYQNLQMIQLLKEIRDSLDLIKEHSGIKNTEEKKI